LGGEEGNRRRRKGKRKSGERGAERWKSDEAESERGGTEGTGGGKKTKGSSRRKWDGIGEKELGARFSKYLTIYRKIIVSLS